MAPPGTDARKAVVLVSGGLDSATVLAIARAQVYECYALSFDYGQRHLRELEAARHVAAAAGVRRHEVMRLDIGWMGGSALTDRNLDVPQQASTGIPITYVPARNTVFLSIALGWAEVLGAFDIFIGANAVDYSGYPDCRPAYLAAFEHTANLATRASAEGGAFKIYAPLIAMSKAEIIATGRRLGVDYSATFSCYDPTPAGTPCGRCDSCRIRARGFAEAGMPDPALR